MKTNMQNQAQLREMASDLLRDAPIDSLRVMLHRMARSEFEDDREALPAFAEWLVWVLEWQLDYERLQSARRSARLTAQQVLEGENEQCDG